jgi:hypothetical protein
MAARKEILARLIEVQSEVGKKLITDAELCRIREIWSNDITAISERRFALANAVAKDKQGAAK